MWPNYERMRSQKPVTGTLIRLGEPTEKSGRVSSVNKTSWKEAVSIKAE